MCEFCMQRGTNIGDPEFAGFFSTAAIEEAMALANKLRGDAGAGEDGTSDDTNTHNSSNDAATTDNDADDSDGT